jgi:hypothetical protein
VAFKNTKMAAATAIILVLTQVPAFADPAVMLGLSLNFGGDESKLGATAKILSDNRPEEVVGAAGVTYFFDDGSVGLDAGIGYTFKGGAATFTYDFLNQSPQLSIGLANIKEINSVC